MQEFSPSAKDFLAGSGAGIAGVLIGQPLDVVRIRLQQLPQAASAAVYMRAMVAQEGMRSLFRGTIFPLTTITLQTAVVFQSFGVACRFISGVPDSPVPLSYSTVASAGLVAGAVQTLVTTPVDLLKIRMQLQTAIPGQPQFIGNLRLLRNIVTREGLTGLYRGFGVTLVRDMPCHVAYFLTYEASKELLEPGSRQRGAHHPLALLAAGGLAGIASWITIYPLDVIKTRLQRTSAADSPYQGWVHCGRITIREGGASALIHGIRPTLARAFLVNGAIFSVYEALMKLMHSHDPADAAV